MKDVGILKKLDTLSHLNLTSELDLLSKHPNLNYMFLPIYVSPSLKLKKTSNKIKSGNLSVKVPQISTKDEMSLLIKTFNEMTQKLKSQRIELKKRDPLRR